MLWVRGDGDQVVSDESMFDFGTLGKLGVVPGWPGLEVYPPQPQLAQVRAVLTRYLDCGGATREVVVDGCGHGPLVERASELRALLAEHVGAASPRRR